MPSMSILKTNSTKPKRKRPEHRKRYTAVQHLPKKQGNGTRLCNKSPIGAHPTCSKQPPQAKAPANARSGGPQHKRKRFSQAHVCQQRLAVVNDIARVLESARSLEGKQCNIKRMLGAYKGGLQGKPTWKPPVVPVVSPCNPAQALLHIRPL